MKLTTISKTFEQTYQLEQYSPVKASTTLTAELAENDDPEQVADELYDQAADMTTRNIAARIAAYEMTEDLAELTGDDE